MRIRKSREAPRISKEDECNNKIETDVAERISSKLHISV